MVKKEGDVFKPILVEEVGDPVLNRAYNRFLIDGHGHRDLTVDGQRYLSAAFRLPQKTGLDLSVFVFVPEEDFVGFVARNNRTILMMSSGIVCPGSDYGRSAGVPCAAGGAQCPTGARAAA